MMGGLNLIICQNFVNLNGGVKIIWGEQYFLLHFHYIIYLETATTQKSKVFLLSISSENVDASGVIYRHPQIY